MRRVDIYSKADCHLCDVAKQVIEKVRASMPFELHVVDIEADPELLGRFGDRIPVVHIDGNFAFQHRVPENEFRRRLEASE